MFYAPKVARLSRETAGQRSKDGKYLYDLAKLDGAVGKPGGLRLKDGYFLRPIQAAVVGCGDTVPNNWDPESRGGFDITASEEDLMNDVSILLDKVGKIKVGNWTNNGADLDARTGAFDDYKVSQRRISDNDKIAWTVTAEGGKFFKVGMLVAEMCRAYDDNHPNA